MNTKLIVGIVGILALMLLVSACTKTPTGQAVAPKIAPEVPAVRDVADTAAEAEAASESNTNEHTVEITSDGFNPSVLVVSSGTTVTFVNAYSVHSWPASDAHPTHRAYPGSDINKCNSVARNSIFDACTRLEQGESYSFTFNERGSWKYHDHLNPRNTGTIMVE